MILIIKIDNNFSNCKWLYIAIINDLYIKIKLLIKVSKFLIYLVLFYRNNLLYLGLYYN